MDSASPFTLLCSRCSSVLSPSRDRLIICATCGSKFPVLADNIPVLVENPDDHCAMAGGEMLATIQYVDSLLVKQERELERCKRPQALRRLMDALRTSSAVVKQLLSMISQRWPSKPLVKDRPPGLTTRMNLMYFVRDWGGRSSAESVIADIMATLRRQLPQTAKRDTALVLGAGTGRFAWELTADFTNVLALDWSIASALSYALLKTGPVALHELNELNVATVEDVAVPVTCEIPPRGGSKDPDRLARLHWVVADGQKAPLSAESCATVFSIYFSDQVLADVLVNEVWRLLCPGGVFVHFGVLGYDHGIFDEMLSAEELCARFVDRGFQVAPCEWAPHLFPSSQSLVQVRMNAFAFRAVKPIPADAPATC